jgi:type I pantothenate kinase
MDALAQVIKDYVDKHAPHTQGSRKAVIVGIAGPVSVGKSTMANHIKTSLEGMGHSTIVVSSDSFLMSNADMDAKGLRLRKGFPETYDEDAIRKFIASLHSEDSSSTSIPIYDHLTYDIIPDEKQEITKTDIVIFEGINVLRFAELLDLKIYVTVHEEDLRKWFYHRWMGLREKAKSGVPSEFLKSFAHLNDEEFQQMLEYVWVNINLPNIQENISPTKESADYIVKKASDHSIESVLPNKD